MTANKHYHHLVYEDLLNLEQGYVDVLLEHFSNREDAEEWKGIQVEDINSASLKIIVRDCRRFYAQLVNRAPEVEEAVLDEMDEYELGRIFFLERMELGVGFHDLSLEPELTQHLVAAAAQFKPFEVELCSCGGFHIVGQDKATGVFL